MNFFLLSNFNKHDLAPLIPFSNASKFVKNTSLHVIFSILGVGVDVWQCGQSCSFVFYILLNKSMALIFFVGFVSGTLRFPVLVEYAF